MQKWVYQRCNPTPRRNLTLAVRVIQINLLKRKVASAELLLSSERLSYNAALVQDPWIASKNMVSEVKSPLYHTYIPSATKKIRTLILGRRSMHSYSDLNFSSDDLTVVAVRDGKNETLLLTFCYMFHDNKSPPAELWKLVDAAEKSKRLLVICADANMHHTVLGSSDTNERGDSLLNFVMISNLDIATYTGPISKNVLKVTLYTSTRIRGGSRHSYEYSQ